MAYSKKSRRKKQFKGKGKGKGKGKKNLPTYRMSRGGRKLSS